MHCRITALFLGLSNTCGNRNAQYLTSGTLSQCQPICLSYCLTRPHSVCPAPKDFRHSQPNQVGMNHHQEVRWMYKRSVCIFSWLELLFSYLANCCDWLTDLWSNVQLSQKNAYWSHPNHSWNYFKRYELLANLCPVFGMYNIIYEWPRPDLKVWIRDEVKFKKMIHVS